MKLLPGFEISSNCCLILEVARFHSCEFGPGSVITWHQRHHANPTTSLPEVYDDKSHDGGRGVRVALPADSIAIGIGDEVVRNQRKSEPARSNFEASDMLWGRGDSASKFEYTGASASSQSGFRDRIKVLQQCLFSC
jgi:hypothetical protein